MVGACSRVDGGDQKTATWSPQPPFMAPRAVLPQTGSAGAGHGTVVTTPTVVSGHGLNVPGNDAVDKNKACYVAENTRDARGLLIMVHLTFTQ